MEPPSGGSTDRLVDTDVRPAPTQEAELDSERDFAEFEFRTVSTNSLTTADRRLLFELFDGCFRQANHAHLEKLLGQLRYVSLARRDETPAGFSVGEVRNMDLPRLGEHTVMLGGLTCVAAEFRRRGLMIELAMGIITASARRWSERALFCVRYGHPAAFKSVVASSESGVPRPGIEPTAWQQEVGGVIAEAYGVEQFDPKTFVCRGSGTPVGYPIMDVEVEPLDWEVFRHVDRDRGDSLLGIVWRPDAPYGWA
jgi:hypothetical protein